MVLTIRKITFLLFITLGLLAMTVTAGGGHDTNVGSNENHVDGELNFSDEDDLGYSEEYSDELYGDYGDFSYEESEEDGSEEEGSEEEGSGETS